MSRSILISLVFILLTTLFHCQPKDQDDFNEEEYLKSHNEWKTSRLNNLKSEEGWLNLVGLYWLEEGINEFGSNKENKIIFPEGNPDFIGAFIKFKGSINISVNEGVDVFVNDSLISEYHVKTDTDNNPTVFKAGNYSWTIIKRNGKYAIRLRDLKNPLIDELNKIPDYPPDLSWRVAASFDRFDTPVELQIENVLGSTDSKLCFGSLSFIIKEKPYTLFPLGDGINDKLFLMFGDKTSASETYGGGRYLYVDRPDSTGKTIIDFNKATNPPCAFTEFATCPLPPKENLLDVELTAGEKLIKELIRH